MTFSQAYDAAPTEVQDALAFFFKLLNAPQVRAILAKQDAVQPTFILPEQTRPGNYDYLRECVARQIWEPTTRADLVDRIAKAIAAGWISVPEWRRAREEARRAVDCYRATDGRSGAQFMWKPLGAWCKEIYAAHGQQWAPTRPGREPDPRANQQAEGTAKN